MLNVGENANNTSITPESERIFVLDLVYEAKGCGGRGEGWKTTSVGTDFFQYLHNWLPSYTWLSFHLSSYIANSLLSQEPFFDLLDNT